MKKVLACLVVCSILAIASGASALEVLGGRLGAGVEYIAPGYGYGEEPFISFDPIPSLQLRLGGYVDIDPVTTSNPQADAYTAFGLSGLYRLWSGNWAPHVGLRLAFGNDSNDDGTTRTVSTAGSLIFGVEWNVLNNISLFMDTAVINAYTETNKDGDLTDAETRAFGNEVILGGVVYLD